MKKRFFLMILALLLVSALFADETTEFKVKGATFPTTLQVGEQTLVLNGADVRQKTIFNVNIYGLGLYLTEKNNNPDEIIVADKPMAIRLIIMTGLITAKEFIESTLEAYNESTKENTAPIQKEIDTFISVFQEGIVKHDVYDITYTPNLGIQVFKNGATESPVCIPGLAIKQATFGIWVGERSDKRLMEVRENLLNR